MRLPVYDTGFVQGAAISEQLRTFSGRLFRLDEHLGRLHRSLEIVGLAEQVSVSQISAVAEELVDRNYKCLDVGDDLGVSLFVTPGPYPTFAPPAAHRPSIGLHTYRLPFHLWVKKYALGDRLIVSRIRQVPEACWPAELKCRSRMHYYLADREAQLRDGGARALLLDLDGHVAEASTANIIIYRSADGFVSPPREMILPGVSVGVVEELAGKLEISFTHHPLVVEDLLTADEILLSSTSPCVWPVVSVDGKAIGDRQPGPIAKRILSAWSEMVGVDIRAQAERFAVRAAAE
jgi:branched-subunit amino acid aminotransferase/4-amino-4-deoxychorismate lyase